MRNSSFDRNTTKNVLGYLNKDLKRSPIMLQAKKTREKSGKVEKNFDPTKKK